MNYLLNGGGAQGLTPDATSKYFQQSLVKPAYRDFDLNVAPRIKEAFAAGGGQFNSRMGVELANALGGVKSSIDQQLGTATLQNQQLAAQLGTSSRIAGLQAAPGVANQNFTSAALMEGVLSPFQDQATQQAQAKYQEFLRTAPENNPYFNNALAFTGQSQLGVYNKPNTLGTLGTVAGGLLLGPLLGGIGGSLAGAFGFGGATAGMSAGNFALNMANPFG